MWHRHPNHFTVRNRHAFDRKPMKRIAIATARRTVAILSVLSLAKLYLVRAFRFCYFNDLNWQTHQVSWPQAVIKYSSLFCVCVCMCAFDLKPNEVKQRRNDLQSKCETDLRTLKKVSLSLAIGARFRYRLLLFCFSCVFSIFLFSILILSRRSGSFMTCGRSSWNIFLCFMLHIITTWWLLQQQQ